MAEKLTKQLDFIKYKKRNNNMNNKFDDWINNVLAPWAITVVFGTNFIVFMLILGQLAFRR